jgi:transaldolase
VWLDYLRRGMTQSGELQAMIERGVRGLTSNPTIFEHAIGGSSDYDDSLRDLAASDRTDLEVFEVLAVEDVRAAADLFRPLYDETRGRDGYVSLEVSPRLARDTENTIAEGRRLWAAVDRPNVMIKVPGTEQGWPAIERLLVDGVNVNVTLLFSPEHYIQVAVAYLKALETRLAAGRSIDRVASVASFFVSRVDTGSTAGCRKLAAMPSTCGERRPSQMPSSRTPRSRTWSAGHAGGDWRPVARIPSDSSGPPPA